jgi:inner membrane protein
VDSVTQIALGAAVGETVLGRKVGYRAALWGGICGTLPDLDSFVPYQDAVATVTYQRSYSHSLIVLARLTPSLVWLIQKVHSQTTSLRQGWGLLVYLVFATHVLLDAATVYGTQLFWPLSNHPFSGSAVFIIDPGYTLPLIIGVFAALVLSRRRNTGHYINYAGLVLSTLYLGWAFVAKAYVEERLAASLEKHGIASIGTQTAPTAFNTILWRCLIVSEQGFHEGFYSVLDERDDIEFTHYPSDTGLLDGIEDHWPVRRLKWFTHGLYSVTRSANDVIMTDLRMGLEPNYVFRYKVAEVGNPHAQSVTSSRVYNSFTSVQFRWLQWRLANPQ